VRGFSAALFVNFLYYDIITSKNHPKTTQIITKKVLTKEQLAELCISNIVQLFSKLTCVTNKLKWIVLSGLIATSTAIENKSLTKTIRDMSRANHIMPEKYEQQTLNQKFNLSKITDCTFRLTKSKDKNSASIKYPQNLVKR
jgi:hypothetical protein